MMLLTMVLVAVFVSYTNCQHPGIYVLAMCIVHIIFVVF